MKFGKVLQQSIALSEKSWEKKWLDYKGLKGLVKECVNIQPGEKLTRDALQAFKKAYDDQNVCQKPIDQSKEEKHFFVSLRQELKKVSEFFVQEQTSFVDLTKTMVKEFNEIQTVTATLSDHGASASSALAARQTAWIAACVSLYKELLLLENFSVMNYIGISKILKKHDKWTGYVTRQKFLPLVINLPFVTSEGGLLVMLNKLEAMYMESTGGCKMDGHDMESHTHPTTPMASSTATATISTSSHPSTPEAQATLSTIHSLRDNASELKKLESLESRALRDEEDLACAPQVCLSNNPLYETKPASSSYAMKATSTTPSATHKRKERDDPSPKRPMTPTDMEDLEGLEENGKGTPPAKKMSLPTILN